MSTPEDELAFGIESFTKALSENGAERCAHENMVMLEFKCMDCGYDSTNPPAPSPEPAVLTREEIEQLLLWSSIEYENEEKVLAHDAALRERCEALEKENEWLESFKIAHEDITGKDGDWLERAHRVASKEPGRLGANVWHVAVERAERLDEAQDSIETLTSRMNTFCRERNTAEAEVARLRKIVEEAPHAITCPLWRSVDGNRIVRRGVACDCWKREAHQPAKEGK